MTTEILIFKTKLSNLFDPIVIDALCAIGYRETGNKISIGFEGSKGYLDHLEIICEGYQIEENRLFEIFNKNGSVKKKVINIFYSETNGIRLSTGKDKPRVVEDYSKAESDLDLPF